MSACRLARFPYAAVAVWKTDTVYNLLEHTVLTDLFEKQVGNNFSDFNESFVKLLKHCWKGIEKIFNRN